MSKDQEEPTKKDVLNDILEALLDIRDLLIDEREDRQAKTSELVIDGPDIFGGAKTSVVTFGDPE